MLLLKSYQRFTADSPRWRPCWWRHLPMSDIMWSSRGKNSLSTTLPFRFPVHRLHWSRHSLSPPCPFRPSSIRQTSVGPVLLIPSAFYTPLPSTTPPPPPPHTHTLTPLYLAHKTPPTLTHWWFSTWGAQPRHPTDRSPPLTHQPINLYLPTP